MSAWDFVADLAVDVGEAAVDFVKDIDLEDIATIATTGIAISSFLDSRDIKPTSTDVIKGASTALSEGKALVSQSTIAPTVQLGADLEETEANREATRRRLRVKRDTSATGARTGLQANPLGIRI